MYFALNRNRNLGLVIQFAILFIIIFGLVSLQMHPNTALSKVLISNSCD